jgi:hypothetical protein
MAKPESPSYSHSKLEIFDFCPFAYQKIYHDKIPRAESEALKIGSLLHRIIADYLNRLIHYGTPTDWEWAQGATPREAPPDVPEIWERFYSSFSLPPMEAPGVERKLAFNRDWEAVEFFGPDAFFRAVVDLAFRQDALAVVVDWKSNRAVPETVEKNLQLRIYGWAVKTALYPDVQEVLLRLHFLRYGAEREILLSPDDLVGVPQELKEQIAIIEAEKHFNPRPGSFCSWCGVQTHCPVISQALVPIEVLAPATREQATKAATLLLAIGEMEKVLTARLNDWVKENGALSIGDLIYGPVPSLRYDMIPQEVTAHLMELGVPREVAWAALNISKTSISSALSQGGYKGKRKPERDAIMEQVLAEVPSKTTESIKFYKQRAECIPSEP